MSRPLPPSMRLRLRPAVLTVGVLALAACSDSAAPPPVASITIAAARQTIRLGDTVSLAATLRDDRGGMLPARAVAWRSETPEVAAIVDSRLVARGIGDARIVASTGDVEGRATFTVRSQPVTSVVVEPSSLELYAGDSAQLRVTLRDAEGRLVPDVVPTVSPAMLGHDVLRVGAGHWLRALAGGRAEVSVSADGVRATATVRVRERPLVGLRAVRRTMLVEPGVCFDNRLVGVTRDGRELALDAVLAPQDSAVVRREPSGAMEGCWRRFSSAAPGTTTLEATFDSLTVSVPVTVLAPVASGFAPTIRWFGPAHPAVEASLVGAVARWSRVVVGDLPDRRLVLPADACFPGSPAIDEVVDDVLVHVYAGPLDGAGGTLAKAGPCATREDSGLPIAGIVMIDAADVGPLATGSPYVERVLMHEFGHVLGIGTLWDAHLGGRAVDPRFVGPRARLAAGDFGFLPQERDGIEVETAGGGTTAGSHWRESTFGSELMTGWIAEHDPTTLSALTAGVLDDLGYTIGYAAVDAVSPPSPRAYSDGAPLGWPYSSRVAPRGGIPLDDRPIRPRFTVRADGSARPIAR